MGDLRVSRRDELKRRLEERKRKQRKRRSRLLLLALLLLLLLVSRCNCVEDLQPAQGPSAPVPELTIEPSTPPEPLPIRLPIKRIERPAFETKAMDPLPWLASFRLQVSARSPRLADCFVGAERPGRLRWNAAVDPVRGQVSEQRLEPVSAWDTLTQEQTDCVKGVLAEPAYTLDHGGAPSTPSRVSMVIEF
ncbi:MAG: hypothetical protein ACI9VR_004350 [Cognaticolwellia sp.]|jgi:hypothetical protein